MLPGFRFGAKKLILTAPLTIQSLASCHTASDIGEEVSNIFQLLLHSYMTFCPQLQLFASPLIYHGLVEFFGQYQPLLWGIKHSGALDGDQLPMPMVAFVVTGVSHFLIF